MAAAVRRLAAGLVHTHHSGHAAGTAPHVVLAAGGQECEEKLRCWPRLRSPTGGQECEERLRCWPRLRSPTAEPEGFLASSLLQPFIGVSHPRAFVHAVLGPVTSAPSSSQLMLLYPQVFPDHHPPLPLTLGSAVTLCMPLCVSSGKLASRLLLFLY